MNRMKLGPLAGLSGSHPESHENHQKNQKSYKVEDPSADPFADVSKLPLGDLSIFDDDSDFSAGEADYSIGNPAYSVFMPVHYQSNYSYPVVVWLHSADSNHRQLDTIMPLISDRNYIGVSLVGTEQRSENGFGWLQASDSIELATNQVSEILQSIEQRYNINRNRIFVAGQGAGGTMAYRIAFERPELFAGVVSLNGSLPSTLNPLSNWRSCRKLPVFWMHGRQSAEFPESNLCHQLRLLHVAGFDVTLRQYPCEDQVPIQVYGDLNTWMMEQLADSGANIIG